MKEFNRTNLATLNADMQAAMNEVAKKHGLASITISGTKFSSTSCSFKAEARTCDRRNDAQWMAVQSVMATRLGLPSNVVGQRFEFQGHSYEVDRINPKCRMRPVVCKQIGTSKSYKFLVATVQRGLIYTGA